MNQVAPTHREIEPELYKEHYTVGIRNKDFPIILIGAAVFFFGPLYLRFGAITGGILLLVWLAASSTFFRWARSNRRPLWLEHKIERFRLGKIQHRVDPTNERYASRYIVDENE